MRNFFLTLETFSIPVNIGLLLLRLLFGMSLLINHGLPTFMSLLNHEVDYPDPLGIGTLPSKVLMCFAEFLCSALVTLGVFTRLSALPILMGFGVAFFIYHASDPFGHKELSYLYGSAFLVIFGAGPGPFSVDRWILSPANSGYPNRR